MTKLFKVMCGPGLRQETHSFQIVVKSLDISLPEDMDIRIDIARGHTTKSSKTIAIPSGRRSITVQFKYDFESTLFADKTDDEFLAKQATFKVIQVKSKDILLCTGEVNLTDFTHHNGLLINSISLKSIRTSGCVINFTVKCTKLGGGPLAIDKPKSDAFLQTKTVKQNNESNKLLVAGQNGSKEVQSTVKASSTQDTSSLIKKPEGDKSSFQQQKGVASPFKNDASNTSPFEIDMRDTPYYHNGGTSSFQQHIGDRSPTQSDDMFSVSPFVSNHPSPFMSNIHRTSPSPIIPTHQHAHSPTSPFSPQPTPSTTTSAMEAEEAAMRDTKATNHKETVYGVEGQKSYIEGDEKVAVVEKQLVQLHEFLKEAQENERHEREKNFALVEELERLRAEKKTVEASLKKHRNGGVAANKGGTSKIVDALPPFGGKSKESAIKQLEYELLRAKEELMDLRNAMLEADESKHRILETESKLRATAECERKEKLKAERSKEELEHSASLLRKALLEKDKILNDSSEKVAELERSLEAMKRETQEDANHVREHNIKQKELEQLELEIIDKQRVLRTTMKKLEAQNRELSMKEKTIMNQKKEIMDLQNGMQELTAAIQNDQYMEQQDEKTLKAMKGSLNDSKALLEQERLRYETSLKQMKEEYRKQQMNLVHIKESAEVPEDLTADGKSLNKLQLDNLKLRRILESVFKEHEKEAQKTTEVISELARAKVKLADWETRHEAEMMQYRGLPNQKSMDNMNVSHKWKKGDKKR